MATVMFSGRVAKQSSAGGSTSSPSQSQAAGNGVTFVYVRFGGDEPDAAQIRVEAARGRAEKFTWANSADQLAAAYRAVHAEGA